MPRGLPGVGTPDRARRRARVVPRSGAAGRRRPDRRHPPDRQRAARGGRADPDLRRPVLRPMLLGKIHRATVTDADLHYVGSLTVDADLLDAADLLPNQQVDVADETEARDRRPHVVFVDADNRIVEAGEDAGHVPDGYGVRPSGLRIEGRDLGACLLYTSPSPRDGLLARM